MEGCMVITATQLRQNLKEYLRLSTREDIYVTCNGKILAKITNPYADKISLLRSLRGSLSPNANEGDVTEERTKAV